jgi:hypothetical protein
VKSVRLQQVFHLQKKPKEDQESLQDAERKRINGETALKILVEDLKTNACVSLIVTPDQSIKALHRLLNLFK